ncbi:MAG: cytochrome c nitrite reductase small subunit [Candidatus Latescibacteria bacterium]|nr:cytochrome c nitrite reductase small subunit [Candidatus Latescibacterota bacterium]
MRLQTLQWAVLGVAIGLAAGVGGYTFIYARGASYMTNDPAACANCHIMGDHFDAWVKSSHRAVAVCNDCHTPPGLVGKYAAKASNGFWHSFAFTSGRFPDPLRIKPHNREITEQACRKFHQEIVEAIDARHQGAGQIGCIRCHLSVGHMR